MNKFIPSGDRRGRAWVAWGQRLGRVGGGGAGRGGAGGSGARGRAGVVAGRGGRAWGGVTPRILQLNFFFSLLAKFGCYLFFFFLPSLDLDFFQS
jgi:hypothetical protein